MLLLPSRLARVIRRCCFCAGVAAALLATDLHALMPCIGHSARCMPLSESAPASRPDGLSARARDLSRFARATDRPLPLLARKTAGRPGSRYQDPLPRGLRQHLHNIPQLDLEVAVRPDASAEAAAMTTDSTAVLSPHIAKSTGPHLDVDISEVRRSTLQNHLDVQVEVLRPSISREAIVPELARFDPVVFGSRLRFDSETTRLAAEVDQDRTSTQIGTSVQLPTGGRVTVSVPLEEQILTNAAGHQIQESRKLSMAFSQPVLRNAGRTVNNAPILAARLVSGQTDARSRLTMTTFLSGADRAYWNLWGATREVEIRYRQYELTITLLEQVRRLAEGELIARVEITRTRSGVTRRVAAAVFTEAQRRAAAYELMRIMNRPGIGISANATLVPRTEPELLRYQLDPEDLVLHANANRMDLMEAELQIALDAITEKVARNQTLPELNLDFASNRNRLESRAPIGVPILDHIDDWQVQLALSYPIGNRAAEARLRQAELQKELSQRTADARRLQIRRDVLSAHMQLELTWQRILAARQDTRASDAIFRAEQLEFELGERTSTEVLEAAQFLADAQINEVRAMRDYELAKIDLATATGTLLGYGNVRVADDSHHPANR